MKEIAETDAMDEREREEPGHKYPAAKAFHEHAAEYDEWFAGSLVYAIELAALRSLHTVMPEPKVEVGVGPGRFAGDLGVAFGLDPARAPLRLALQRGIKCCQGVGEELPIKNGAVGAVYLLFSLCFGVDPQKIVAECSRILKDGGHLVIGMIPAESKWGKHLAARKEAGRIFYEHAHFYTIEPVKQWLARADMGIIEYRSTLYQHPEHVEQGEEPREALDEQAGFVVMVARKDHV
jgi:SAM-dependent methyltransferase